jgi:hypothetical protein
MKDKIYTKSEVYEWLSHYRIKYSKKNGFKSPWMEIYDDAVRRYLMAEDDGRYYFLETMEPDGKRAPIIKITKVSPTRFC